jgi:hypothetical protein
MRSYAKFFLMLAILPVSLSLWTQEVFPIPGGRGLLARLSYANSGSVQREGVRHICVAVSRDGDYRLVRSLAFGTQTEQLQGTMTKEQLQKLTALLHSNELRAQSGSHPHLVWKETESFVAEIPHRAGTQRLDWLNADGENPFPDSVAKVVDWLKHFEPQNAKGGTGYLGVCPVEIRPLQPSLATKIHP